jgi:hypothetical protein
MGQRRAIVSLQLHGFDDSIKIPNRNVRLLITMTLKSEPPL